MQSRGRGGGGDGPGLTAGCGHLGRIKLRLILAHDGVLNWTLAELRLPGLHIGYSNWAMWIVFSYLWLPFMILPVAAAVERIPPSLLEASLTTNPTTASSA